MAYSSSNLFKKAFYDKRSTTVKRALEIYEELLLGVGDENSILHANKIRQYRSEITNKKYLSDLKRNFNALYSLIDKQYPGLNFAIEGRIKAVISFDKKVVKKINNQESLDLLRDTTGFRILIFGPYSQEKQIKLCYELMNSIIKHNNSDYTLCNAEPVNNTLNLADNNHQIVIPKKSEISSRYLYGVKDYILNPKTNGYQSLQATFRRQKGGECFEVQVRTLDMHVYAETGEASHSNYKRKKYTDYQIDRKKIHIPGYLVSPVTGEVFDFVGLETGSQIIRRTKTF